jgi:6-phosphofructokinase 1
MAKKSKTTCIGILTSGGDCPGLNAAIRGVASAAMHQYGIKVIGFLDGFRGLVQNRTIPLDPMAISGILTRGGTILGTSRDKPYKMPIGGLEMDMTAAAKENALRLQLDCLVCLGGGGTQKNALYLQQEAGINVLTLPKTIDNDVFGTDMSFGFDTAMSVATEAIDRLHSTATSHHRIIVVEIMGHNAGWLPLGAGIAGGADVILIPEIPYDLRYVAEHLSERRRLGKRFSIIAVGEGAMSREEAKALEESVREKDKKGKEKDREKEKNKGTRKGKDKDGKKGNHAGSERDDSKNVPTLHLVQEPKASRIARQLQQLTGTEARVTSLGHVVRGGTPTAYDRLLCTRLGVKAAELLAEGVYNVMVALKGEECVPVPLEKVAGNRKAIPLDHPWIRTAQLTGTCLGTDF